MGEVRSLCVLTGKQGLDIIIFSLWFSKLFIKRVLESLFTVQDGVVRCAKEDLDRIPGDLSPLSRQLYLGQAPSSALFSYSR